MNMMEGSEPELDINICSYNWCETGKSAVRVLAGRKDNGTQSV